jgi:hypothetical protein
MPTSLKIKFLFKNTKKTIIFAVESFKKEIYVFNFLIFR